MQEIPDTGGGLSGFIAWLLWQAYQYFPFEGTWDWLLLFVFLAVAMRALAAPTSWKLAKWASTQDAAIEGCLPNKAVWGFLFHTLFAQTGVMFLFVWFFSTGAGHTFLEERMWFGGESVLGTNTWVLLWIGFLLVTGVAVGIGIDALDQVLGFPRTQLEQPAEVLFASSILHFLIVLGAYVFYWRWSRASLILMCVFTVVDWVALIGVMLWTAPCLNEGKT